MPITIDDIILLQVDKEEILSAIEKAKESHFLDNLRIRHDNVSFDSKIRGYIGELAVKKWFQNEGIIITTENYIDNNGNIDIDFLFRKGEKSLDIELKTSLIPDADYNFNNVIRKRDIKLIRRENLPIENLKSDIHIQVYFKQLTNAKDNWLISKNIDLQSNDLEYLYNELGASRYINDTYLFAWIDKSTLINQINAKPIYKRTWSYRMREFWTCKLSTEAKKPRELVQFLRNF